ncbi:MAG: asparagine synthase (glutamine-hydrolyzing) [Nitrospirae bacterium]|nr:asparagine synthase (glutamine-hydrolyzing) [Nitrospirota bacterium]
MCGISAIFSFNEKFDFSVIKKMTDTVRHRGPDDEGFALFYRNSKPRFFAGAETLPVCIGSGYRYSPNNAFPGKIESDCFAAFGHRRLSIIDLSPAGHQPMCTEDERYTIIYNGEIYNYLELRKELELLGQSFVSNSDTEVILNAYRYWGRDCLNRFNGMFAFIIFDKHHSKIFAARDRFGVKPLYYWYSPNGFLAFASEIKQFTALPGWRAVLNGQRAYDFLNWGISDHTSETLFNNVFQFRGGECIENFISDLKNGLDIGRWYDLKHLEFGESIDEAANIFREVFTDSVRLRLRADVPVGTGLSGGIDSSSIVCVVNDLLREKNALALQKTFSACSDIKRFDERGFIEEVVRQTGVAAHYTYPQLDNLFDEIEEITWHHDEPFLSTSVFAEWRVFKLVKENSVKVTLDGHGADELLAGYHSFFGPYFLRLFRNIRLLTLFSQIAKMKQLYGYTKIYAFQHILNMLLPEIIRQPVRRFLKQPSTNPSWLNMDMLRTDDADPVFAYGEKTESIGRLSFSQFFHTSLPVQLHWSDRDSMAHSIESRAPFLDYRIVEFLMGLPDEFKLSDMITKQVLRRAMKNILPENIRMRTDKMGFVTPEEIWMRKTAPDRFIAAVRQAIDSSQGILKPAAMVKAERIINGTEKFSFFVWRLVSFGKWMERFKVKTA